MASSSPQGKRKVANEPISPPPVKRNLQSSTTKASVASFFTPTSQNPKKKIEWSERAPAESGRATLLVGRHSADAPDATPTERRKVAAFDLDSTLIITQSGKKHASGAADWKWWDSCVPGRLGELYHDQGYRVVILSNQGGLTLALEPGHKGPKESAQKRVGDFKKKCNAVLSSLDFPTSVYVATENDMYRKPRPGMWQEMCRDYGLREDEVDLANSFFVGDAGGRIATLGNGSDKVTAVAKDFSCFDRNFAHNVGIAYKTPEEFFLKQRPRDFCRDFDLDHHPFCEAGPEVLFEKRNQQDIVVHCGPPGAGKSTFYWTFLKPLGYERVNQDTLKTRDKCVQAARELLSEGRSVAIGASSQTQLLHRPMGIDPRPDNTNADPQTRAVWVELAKKAKLPIRCLWFMIPLHLCEHNDAVRAHNKTLNPEARQGLPRLAFTGFAFRFKEPKVQEGFQDVKELSFKFRGTREEYDAWGRYWA